MKFIATSLLLLASATTASAALSCISGPFQFDVDDSDQYCDFDQLLEHFTEFFNDPVNVDATCAAATDVATEFYAVFGATTEDAARAAHKQVCQNGLAAHYATQTPPLPFADTVRYYDDAWLKRYYDGGTKFNEEVATMYPPYDVNDRRNPQSNLLKRDAAQVNNFYQGMGRYGTVEWPDQYNNFQTTNGGECAYNAAYCCWPTDRQANDNNGNCAKPYDINCVDKDPADNTDLCFVDTTFGSDVTGYTNMAGSIMFPGDDGNNQNTAEGPIHCHGLAWATDPLDPSHNYRGNNIFYVSLYDHLYQRGYVRNVPGAPMCGCAEHMPVVSRSDCTQIDLDINYVFKYSGSAASIETSRVAIDFNSCEGIDPYGDDDNNDLWSYAHRLFLEGKYSKEDLQGLTQRLVGDDPNNCKAAQKKQYTSMGVTRGYEHDATMWKHVAGREALFERNGYGAIGFAEYLFGTPNQIIRRVCPMCQYTHREIFYKRLTPIPETMHLLEALKSGRPRGPPVGNTYGTDFELYSTYEDAINGANEWGCQTYRYRDGFPGGCNPRGGQTRGQQSIFGSRSGQQQDVAFYVEEAPNSFKDHGVISVGDKPEHGFAFEKDGRLVVSGLGWMQGQNTESFDFYALPQPGHITLEVKLEQFIRFGTHAKTGLMIREGTDGGSRFFAITVNGRRPDLEISYRNVVGDRMHEKARVRLPNTNGVWMKLEKRIDTFTAYTKSTDDGPWVKKWQSFTIDMDESQVQAGIYVTGGSSVKAAEGVFSNFANEQHFFPSAAPSASPAPSAKGEETYDIGDGNFAAFPGSTSYVESQDKWSIQASGRDIWNSRDGFHLAVLGRMGQQASIIAEVSNLVGNNQWMKAGVMFRDDTPTGQTGFEKNVAIALTKRNGVLMQYRNATRARSYTAHSPTRGVVFASRWIKLTKDGSTYMGYMKENEGDAWELVAQTTVSFDSTQTIVGLALSSHEKSQMASGDYTGVQVFDTVV